MRVAVEHRFFIKLFLTGFALLAPRVAMLASPARSNAPTLSDESLSLKRRLRRRLDARNDMRRSRASPKICMLVRNLTETRDVLRRVGREVST